MTKDGGTAFPSEIAPFNPGMTLRDWFAGQALSDLAATDAEDVALECYQLADAMIAQRGM